MLFRLVFSVTIALLLLISGCAPPGNSPDVVTVSEDDLDRRWALLPLREKVHLLKGDDHPRGKEALRDYLQNENGWSSLALTGNLSDDPVVKARMQEATSRVLFQELVRRQALADLVTEADIQDYYHSHQDAFTLPEEVRIAQILITPKGEMDITNESRDDAVDEVSAKEKVRSVEERLGAGETFSDLARELSEGRQASRGGDMGWFGRGSLVDVVEEAAFMQEVDQVSGALKTEYGYHFLYVLDRRGGFTLPLEEVRRNVEDFLLLQKSEEVRRVEEQLFATMKEEGHEQARP